MLKKSKMPTQIITTDDLREFKTELLEDIKKLLSTTSENSYKKYLKAVGPKRNQKMANYADA